MPYFRSDPNDQCMGQSQDTLSSSSSMRFSTIQGQDVITVRLDRHWTTSFGASVHGPVIVYIIRREKIVQGVNLGSVRNTIKLEPASGCFLAMLSTCDIVDYAAGRGIPA